MKHIQNLFQRIVVNTLSVAVLIGIAIPSAFADADLPKSKDHPLLTRFPDSRITEYHGEKRGDLYFTKEMLLAVGDRYEGEIASAREADARFR